MLRVHRWLNSLSVDVDDDPDGPRSPSLLPGDWLFSATAEPMLIVVAATERIVEANPSAVSLLRTTSTGLLGSRLSKAFEAASVANIEACLAVVQAVGSAETSGVRPFNGGRDMSAHLSLLRVPSEAYVLVRLAPVDAPTFNGERRSAESVVFQSIEMAPVGFVLTDHAFRIEYANPVFAAMVGEESPCAVRGSSLIWWLRLSQHDLEQLTEQVSQRQATTHLKTQLDSHRTPPRNVDVCAIAVPAGADTCWGFSVESCPLLS